ncbi:MAG: TetR/AcrR family transcriptional regulator [Hyphomonadaceae bacterium]|nr:TetR/AcrR family transcriptional regulator [Hyphomonadaceae bacterium]
MTNAASIGKARTPRQDRSRASYERMLAISLDLLKERGGAGFTLAEVSRLGGVSIGSIYCRFENKDALIRDVHGRLMTRYLAEQRALLKQVRRHGSSLSTLVPRFVEEYAEFLRARAPYLSPFMVLAAGDETIVQAGKRAHFDLCTGFQDMVLQFRAEIGRPDPARAAASMFGVIYSALARYLGLGGAVTAAGEGDWEDLKQDLGSMALAFLRKTE